MLEAMTEMQKKDTNEVILTMKRYVCVLGYYNSNCCANLEG